MLDKEYWFCELFIGLKVAASFDRNESLLILKPKGANVA